jgi:hypothetical protein
MQTKINYKFNLWTRSQSRLTLQTNENIKPSWPTMPGTSDAGSLCISRCMSSNEDASKSSCVKVRVAERLKIGGPNVDEPCKILESKARNGSASVSATAVCCFVGLKVNT